MRPSIDMAIEQGVQKKHLIEFIVPFVGMVLLLLLLLLLLLCFRV
jgi:hypothetical protein